MIDRATILKIIRQQLEQDEEVDEFVTQLGDRELTRMIFHQTVAGEDNLRLSLTGYGFLKKSFEAYEQPFEENYALTARDLLFLKENCRFPYYVSIKGKMFGLFEREMAMRIKLAAGNLSVLF